MIRGGVVSNGSGDSGGWNSEAVTVTVTMTGEKCDGRDEKNVATAAKREREAIGEERERRSSRW